MTFNATSGDQREFNEAISRIVTAALIALADKVDAEKLLARRICERIAEIHPTMHWPGAGQQIESD